VIFLKEKCGIDLSESNRVGKANLVGPGFLAGKYMGGQEGRKQQHGTKKHHVGPFKEKEDFVQNEGWGNR
jgi:hypothetical protein